MSIELVERARPGIAGGYADPKGTDMTPSTKTIDFVDAKHEEAHDRLRGDFERECVKVTLLQAADAETKLAIQRLEASVKALGAGTDVTKIVFPQRVVAAIVLACLSIAGLFWASTYGIRSDVRDILTHQAAQVELDKVNMKLEDERSDRMRASIDAMRNRQEMQQFEIQGLTKEIIAMKASRPTTR